MKILILFLFILLNANEKVFISATNIKIPKLRHILKQKIVIKTKPFYIDKYEVSCGEIKNICSKIKCNEDIQNICGIYDTNNTPISSISYNEAMWICKQKQGRLPTEEEWIAAASIKNNKFYPYGNINLKKRNFDNIDEIQNTQKNINNIYGMFGNVSEIVKSNSNYVIIKGGSFFDMDKLITLYKSKIYLFDSRIKQTVIKKYLKSLNQTGFRCVYDKN